MFMYDLLVNPKAGAVTKDNPLALWQQKYDSEFVAQNLELPKNLNETPRILGWAGPARSGTTALLFLLAGHNEVGHVYFQPQKTLMRLGHPRIKLYSSDKLVCMKETFVSWQVVDELYDPIEVLLKAGVPAEKITWIFMLRDPEQTYRSWCMLAPDVQPDPAAYALWQSHTVKLWQKYKDSKVQVIPFVYELMRGHEQETLGRLLSKIGLNDTLLNLEFNQTLIDRKFVPGQAADETYFENSVKKSLSRGKYAYSTNSYPADRDSLTQIASLCRKEYEDFKREARATLGL